MPYQYITRKEWGAREPKGPIGKREPSTHAVVHHTADPNEPRLKDFVGQPGALWFAKAKTSKIVAQAIDNWRKDHADLIAAEKAAMRAMQNFHMDRNGWSDIGYHFVIFPSGHVYQGRDFDAMGAHTIGANKFTGISFAGNFEFEHLSANATASFHLLMKDRGIATYKGHYKYNATACPGRNIKSALGA